MLDEAKIEERLAALEKTVVDLQRQLEDKSASKSRLESLIGSISDENEAAFLEALEYGRAYRQADKPEEEKDG